jgi:hypothetical protein
MDHRSGAQEEQRFEHRVAKEVELAGKDTTCADRVYHVPQLADR